MGNLCYALFDDLNISGEKTMVQCTTCGMLYDDTGCTQQDLERYYSTNEYYATTSEGGGGGASPDNLARYDRILDALDVEPPGFILDYGSGQGGFVARCVERGFRAAGIEPSRRSRQAGQAAGLTLHASLEDFAAHHSEMPIHGVVLSHVLEHVLHPRELVSSLADFATGARVYLETPEASYLETPVQWEELYFEHLTHFRGDSLARLARKSGIELEKEAVTGFSPARATTLCRHLVGRATATTLGRALQSCPATKASQPLPPMPGDSLPPNRPIAIWGISQYAMLLLGSCERLLHVHWLFDSSPAKQGRCIRGVRIKDPANVATLPKNAVLVIPKSPYSGHIRQAADNYGYTGDVVIL